MQKSGICIGSSVAPVLSDIYLAKCDRDIAGRLDERVLKVLRYVDDYLIVLRPSLDHDCVQVVRQIVDIFKDCSQGLEFKLEVPTGGSLQFLDINLRLETSHVCWSYDPRSKKGLLPYDSAHSKLVKRAIAGSCLRASLLNSCHHRCGLSFVTQVKRLASAGFPSAVVVGVAESLVKMFRGYPSATKKQRPSSRPVVIPYIHALSHRIKRVASKFEVPVVFSAPSKLSRLCAAVSRAGRPSVQCDVKHRTPYVACASGVVYQIPLSCGRVYIGQTGRCVNVRAREHSLSLRSSPSGNLAVHCDRCGCSPSFQDIKILARHKNKTAREVDEAFFMASIGADTCVSAPSVALADDEVVFVNKCGRFV